MTDRTGGSPLREIALVGLAVLAGGGLVAGYAAFRIWQRGNVDETRPVDAIVVLGAAQYDGTPSPVFASRLDHAIALYRDGLAPILIVTGGGREGDMVPLAQSEIRGLSHGPRGPVERCARDEFRAVDAQGQFLRTVGEGQHH